MKTQIRFVPSLCSLLVGFGAFAQPGALDPTFGTNGIVTTDVNGGAEEIRHLVLQPDGRILVSGSVLTATEEDMLIVRYTADGSLDATFANGGVLTMDLSGTNDDDLARGMVVLPNGQLLVCCRIFDDTNQREEMALLRLNADGSFDNSFGTNGQVRHGLPNADVYLQHLHLRSDGKFIATGRIDDFQFAQTAVARFNADGSLDGSLGLGGWVFQNVYTSFDVASGSVLLAGDALLCAGWAYDDGAMINNRTLLRFLANGNLDPAFGTSGVVSPTDLTVPNLFRALYSSGAEVVACGAATELVDEDILVERYTATGQPDAGFGVNGRVMLDYQGYDDESQAVFVDASGRVLVCGTASSSVGEDFAAVRLMPDGTPDAGFGTGGWAVHDHLGDDDAETAAVQADGKLLLAGKNNDNQPTQDLQLMRLLVEDLNAVQEHGTTTLALWPNPVSGTLFLRTTRALGPDARVELLDAQGRVLLSERMGALAAGSTVQVEVRELDAGTYLVRVMDEGRVEVVRWVKN